MLAIVKTTLLRGVYAFSAIVLLAGCSAPVDVSDEPSAIAASAPAPDQVWEGHVVASPLDLSLDEWKTPEDLSWQAPEQSTGSFDSDDVASHAAFIQEYAEVASFSEDVLFAGDYDEAMDVVLSSIGESRHRAAYRELYTQEDSPIGFATVLADDVTLWDEVRGHIEWKFEETTAYDLPALYGSVAVSSFFPVTADGNQTWAFVMREYGLVSTDPSVPEDAGFSFSYGYTWGGDRCGMEETNRLNGAAINASQVEGLAQVAESIADEGYTDREEVHDLMSKVSADSDEPDCSATTATASD